MYEELKKIREEKSNDAARRKEIKDWSKKDLEKQAEKQNKKK